MSTSRTGLATRERAHTVLHEVLDRRRPLDDVLATDRRFARLDTRERAFARNLVGTTLRRLGQIDAMIDSCIERPLPRSAAAARNALRIGVCQIRFMNTAAHAAVDTSVALATRRGPDRFGGLVNAVLRRITRRTEDGWEARFPPGLNIPEWLFRSWSAEHGEETADRIAAAHLKTPPVDLTVRDTPGEWAERLGGTVIADRTVRLTSAGDITALAGYEDGSWWVQDAAAALPARLLLASLTGTETKRVCDLCAAPGGKTSQLAAAGLSVAAVDVSARRLQTLSENLTRLKLGADVIEADASAWTPPEAFDGILLDAPCSATGTIRRHPDVAILKSQLDVTRMNDIQKRLLSAAIGLARDGCPIVYSVCSLQPEEGAAVIDAVASEHPEIVRDPISREELGGLPGEISSAGDVRTFPFHLEDQGGMDGFFISRLRKRV